MKINVTGFTPAHNQKGNRKNIVQIPLLLIKILRDAGHEADYNLEDADVNIIYCYMLNSLNSSHVIECLELMKKDNVIVAFDDWRIKQMFENYEKTAKSGKFSKTHPTIDWKKIEENIPQIQKLADGYFPTIIPANKNGDHSLLGVKGDFTVYDPSIYVERTGLEFDHPYDLLPVHASLAMDHKYLAKRNYTYIQVQGAKEDYVWELYNKHRIVMSPPYYHNGSGWWRNRYSLANLANAVIIEDYGGVFGPAYEIERKQVTEKSIDRLFEAQDTAYQLSIMSKEENIEAINSVLEQFK